MRLNVTFSSTEMGFEHLEEVADVEDWPEGEEREDAGPDEIASEE